MFPCRSWVRIRTARQQRREPPLLGHLDRHGRGAMPSNRRKYVNERGATIERDARVQRLAVS